MSLNVDIQSKLGAFELDVQLRTKAGTTVVFGRSGSGKTSLINAIAGLTTPDQGRIAFRDTVLFDARSGIHVPSHQRRIGYVFQNARLFPHLSVAQNLDFGARFAKEPLSVAERRQMIDTLGIAPLLNRRIAALSGGEQQRVALGRALLSVPRLLLMDEPLAALDTARKQEILPYFERLHAQGGPPMIYVTHDMSEIVRLADNIVVLRDGRSVVGGTVEDVLADPANVKLIGVQDAGALVQGIISGHEVDGLSTIELSAGQLHVPKIGAPVGAKVRMRIRAQDVILSVSEPKDLSSQNILRARITEIQTGEGPSVAIALRTGSDRLLARITRRALAQMQLEVGQEVWAVLKANAVPPSAIARSESNGVVA